MFTEELFKNQTRTKRIAQEDAIALVHVRQKNGTHQLNCCCCKSVATLVLCLLILASLSHVADVHVAVEGR